MGNFFSIGYQIKEYEVGVHPGVYLLPPKDIMMYDTLPQTVRNQIYDASMYDLYGKYGGAFDDSMIYAPVGSAKKDYESWLVSNP